tara:strand:- start:492 stop:2384 length:1893 start_codon:yes stop_codon:yes gene_type:complete
MALLKVQFTPGIKKEGTALTAKGGWFDANLVRFRKGLPEKIGGWTKDTPKTFLSTCRALHSWVDLNITKYLGLGTTWKYYIQEGANFNDVTPIRATTSAGDVTFSATNGDATITVTDSSHGAQQNDFVTFSGAATLGGLITAAVLNQEYQIATIVNVNSYTVEAKDTDGDTVTANSSDSGNGGSSVVGAYQINVGLDEYVSGSGWGASTWGDGTFGSVSALSAANQLRLWTHDNFGEDLIMNVRSGGIFYWDTSAKTLGTDRAVALSDLSGANLAPTLGLQTIVSDIDRHVIVLGADPLNSGGTARTGAIDPMFIAWCDQENVTEWEPKAINTAGSARLSAGSNIIGGMRARQEILVWTDTSLYSMKFIGQPFIFSTNLVNEGVGSIGPKAMVNSPVGVFWMDKKGVYNYTGQVKPIPCDVHDYVFGDMNEGQAYKVHGFLNKRFNEVGWYYPSSDSDEIDRYVSYNYNENVWSIGQMNRTAWLDEGLESYPRATYTTSDVGYLYQQEQGNDADGSPMDNVYIESGDFDLQDGESSQYVGRIIPDIKFTGNNAESLLNCVLKTRNYPGESLTTKSTSNVSSSTTKLNVRGRARQVVLRFESDDDNTTSYTLGLGFRIGATRIGTRVNGRR